MNGFEVGGKAGMERKVKNRLLHSGAQSIQICGQWAIFTPSTSP